MDLSKMVVQLLALLVALFLGLRLADLRQEQAFIEAGYQKGPVCAYMSAQWVAPSPKSAMRNVLAQ